MGMLAAACSPALQRAIEHLRNWRTDTTFPDLAGIIADDSAQLGAASLWFWPCTRLAWVAQHQDSLLRAFQGITLHCPDSDLTLPQLQGGRGEEQSPMQVLCAAICSAHSYSLIPGQHIAARNVMVEVMNQLWTLRKLCDNPRANSSFPDLQALQDPSAFGIIMKASYTWDCQQFRVPEELQQLPSLCGTPWARDEQALKYPQLLPDAKAAGIHAFQKAVNSPHSAEDLVAAQLIRKPAELAAQLHLSCLAARFCCGAKRLYPSPKLQHSHVSGSVTLYMQHEHLVLLQATLDIMHSLTNGSLAEMLKGICEKQRIGLVMMDPPAAEATSLKWSKMPADGVIKIFQACSQAFMAQADAGSDPESDSVLEMEMEVTDGSSEDASAACQQWPGDWAFFSYLPRHCHWPPPGLHAGAYREIMLLPVSLLVHE
ncbi:hypothetical protein MMC29_000191 [Sticta canariensis]|nr:hypothetical protein [Sticta canariensis]